MRLYRTKIPQIAKAIIEKLVENGDIEVLSENMREAEDDLIAIMDTFLRRDMDLREETKEVMSKGNIPYDQFSRIRSSIAEAWGHPTGDSVQKYLSRQFCENFMISRFIDEVYLDDDALFKKVIQIINEHNVDETALREEAKARIKNAKEGSVEYEIAFEEALREVKRAHGLTQKR